LDITNVGNTVDDE